MDHAPETAVDAAAYFARRLAHETDCADVHAAMASTDPPIVIDARSRDDHAARHIPGAVSLPHREITADALDRFGSDARFVTYCWGPHCNGATKAAAAIASLGRPVREMLGGMWGWEQEGFAFDGEAFDDAVS